MPMFFVTLMSVCCCTIGALLSHAARKHHNCSRWITYGTVFFLSVTIGMLGIHLPYQIPLLALLPTAVAAGLLGCWAGFKAQSIR